jgi:hypothetical protein
MRRLLKEVIDVRTEFIFADEINASAGGVGIAFTAAFDREIKSKSERFSYSGSSRCRLRKNYTYL